MRTLFLYPYGGLHGGSDGIASRKNVRICQMQDRQPVSDLDFTSFVMPVYAADLNPEEYCNWNLNP